MGDQIPDMSQIEHMPNATPEQIAKSKEVFEAHFAKSEESDRDQIYEMIFGE